MEQMIYTYDTREQEEWTALTCDPRIKPMYEISTYGRIKNNKGKILKADIDKDGYVKFTLQSKDGKKLRFFSHRLVGLQFIPNPENKPEINHKNVEIIDGRAICKHDDNYYKNLEWCTRQENIDHSVKNTLELPQKYGEEAHRSKFQDATVIYICSLLELGYSPSKIMKKIGFKSTADDGYKEFKGLIKTLQHRSAWHFITKMFVY